MNVIRLNPKEVRYSYGYKKEGGEKSQSTGVNLSYKMRGRIDEWLEEGSRSDWVERACELLLALQTGVGQEVWMNWLEKATTDDDLELLRKRLASMP